MEYLTDVDTGFYTETTQKYYDEWLAAAQKMEAAYGMYWMKENKPYQ